MQMYNLSMKIQSNAEDGICKGWESAMQGNGQCRGNKQYRGNGKCRGNGQCEGNGQCKATDIARQLLLLYIDNIVSLSFSALQP